MENDANIIYNILERHTSESRRNDDPCYRHSWGDIGINTAVGDVPLFDPRDTMHAVFDLSRFSRHGFGKEEVQTVKNYIDGRIAKILHGSSIYLWKSWSSARRNLEPTAAMEKIMTDDWKRQPRPMMVFLPRLGKVDDPEDNKSFIALFTQLRGKAHCLIDKKDPGMITARSFDANVLYCIAYLSDKENFERTRKNLPKNRKSSLKNLAARAEAQMLIDLAGKEDKIDELLSGEVVQKSLLARIKELKTESVRELREKIVEFLRMGDGENTPDIARHPIVAHRAISDSSGRGRITPIPEPDMEFVDQCLDSDPLMGDGNIYFLWMVELRRRGERL